MSASARDLRERAFAVVDLAADQFPDRDRLPFPLEKTTEVLRTVAPLMAPWSHLPPNAFRQRFFRDAYDPVDAWHLQLFMRDVADAGDHAALVSAGQALATTIRSYGQGWPTLLGGAVANFAPARDGKADISSNSVQQARLALPSPVPLPLPPILVPGSRENEEYFVKPMIRLGRGIGDAVGGIFRSEKPDEDHPAPGGTSGEAGRAGRIELPENPDDLLKQGWTETTHPEAAAKGRRTFQNQETGDRLDFDKGKPNAGRHQAHDHYHWSNPDSQSKRENTSTSSETRCRTVADPHTYGQKDCNDGHPCLSRSAFPRFLAG